MANQCLGSAAKDDTPVASLHHVCSITSILQDPSLVCNPITNAKVVTLHCPSDARFLQFLSGRMDFLLLLLLLLRARRGYEGRLVHSDIIAHLLAGFIKPAL